MNSLSLKENGFAKFVPLKELSFSSLPFNKASVFILVDSTLTSQPASDILYIGKAKKPGKRILGGYLSGYGGKTARKINSKLVDDGYIEKVSVSWMESDDPKAAQQELLEKFKKEHGDYPTWNASKQPQPKKQSPKPKTSKAKAVPRKSAKPKP